MTLQRIALGTLLAATFALTTLSAPRAAHADKRAKKTLLVVTVTKGFHHDSIPDAEQVIETLGKQTGAWETDFVRTDDEMKAKMTREGLKKYGAIIFANTTGTLPLPEPQALLDYVKNGGGFLAMHSGSDTFHDWPGGKSGEVSPYVKMLGAEFERHNRQCAIAAIIEDPNHPATYPLAKAGATYNPATGPVNLSHATSPEGKFYKAFDEIYLLKNIDRPNLHLLLWLDKHPDDGSPESRKPGEYLIAWCRAYGKGRVFYTSLGHRKEVWHDRYYQEHLTGGIKFVLGIAKGSMKPTPLSPSSK